MSAKRTSDQGRTILQTPIATGGSFLEKLDFSPEERLLLTCARLRLSQGQQEELAGLVAGSLDWEQLLHKAWWHNITPLVFHHLMEMEHQGQVPPEVMARLKSAYLRHVVINLHFQSQLRQVQDVLEAQGVPVILLKGAALAGTVYPDIGLRPMGDLDILVPEEQAQIAHHAVQRMGFSPAGATDEDHRHLPRLQRAGTAAQVEVHRHIVNRDTSIYFDIQGFWRRAQEVSLARRQVWVLAPEDLLIHLAINFFQDRRLKSMVALRQLCDIAEALRFHQDNISWKLFLENVRVYRLEGPVGCVLYLAQCLLDAPVPEEAARQLWPNGFNELQMERFTRRRVLGTRDWVAHALVDPRQSYRPGTVVAAVLRRLFTGGGVMENGDGPSDSRGSSLFAHLGQMAGGARILIHSMCRPKEIREDLAIDRWHHSLYAAQIRPTQE
jgi:hypothetical protein